MDEIKALMSTVEKNNMSAYFANDKNEAAKIAESLLKDGDTVAVGGSMSLFECGIIDMLRNGKYNFLDRYEKNLTRDEINDIFVRSFSADVYLSSVNAITKNGELYNVDGNGNRVAAIMYGPKSVILVVGKNKIVKDINAAVEYVKSVSAPKNCVRLSKNTYCSKTGKCVSLAEEKRGMCSGCTSSERICCDYTIISGSQTKNRIKIIFVNENLGY